MMINRTFILFAFIVVAGCTSFQAPKESSESLLVIYPLRTPQGNIQVSIFPDLPSSFLVDSDGLGLLPLKSGSYNLRWKFPDGTQRSTSINVVENSILYVSPYEMPQPENQAKALELLAFYEFFPDWLGKILVGFGPFTIPRKAISNTALFTISSQPMGADVFLDGQLYGKTPLAVTLPIGRYRMKLQHPSGLFGERFMNLTDDLSLEVNLTPMTTVNNADQRYSLLVFPFIDLDLKNPGVYGGVISSTAVLNFQKDGRFRAFSASVPFPLEQAFKQAENSGADIFLEGTFLQDGNVITVRATLWDVRTQRVRYAEYFEVPAGISVFEALDEGSARFVSNALRELPQAGESIIYRESSLTDELLELERVAWMETQANLRNDKKLSFRFSLGLQLYAPENPLNSFVLSGNPIKPNQLFQPIAPIIGMRFQLSQKFALRADYQLIYSQISFNHESSDLTSNQINFQHHILQTGVDLVTTQGKQTLAIGLLGAVGIDGPRTVNSPTFDIPEELFAQNIFLFPAIEFGIQSDTEQRANQNFWTACLAWRFHFGGWSHQSDKWSFVPRPGIQTVFSLGVEP